MQVSEATNKIDIDSNLTTLYSLLKYSLYALSFDQHEQTKLIADVLTITTVFFKAHKKQI